MSNFVYPAKFISETEGGYSIIFPDIAGCCTCADTMEEAYEMATDALCLCLWSMVDRKINIPKPSSPSNIELSANEFVALIGADVEAYRRKMENKAVKKTLSIPSWLNEKAENAGINFSQMLQKALKEELQITS
jgi:predicted RNase H-like HicB family nuclease/post-segregation antitoxin (ccd killing protein)